MVKVKEDNYPEVMAFEVIYEVLDFNIHVYEKIPLTFIRGS